MVFVERCSFVHIFCIHLYVHIYSKFMYLRFVKLTRLMLLTCISENNKSKKRILLI